MCGPFSPAGAGSTHRSLIPLSCRVSSARSRGTAEQTRWQGRSFFLLCCSIWFFSENPGIRQGVGGVGSEVFPHSRSSCSPRMWLSASVDASLMQSLPVHPPSPPPKDHPLGTTPINSPERRQSPTESRSGPCSLGLGHGHAWPGAQSWCILGTGCLLPWLQLLLVQKPPSLSLATNQVSAVVFCFLFFCCPPMILA